MHTIESVWSIDPYKEEGIRTAGSRLEIEIPNTSGRTQILGCFHSTGCRIGKDLAADSAVVLLGTMESLQ
jgi:hypothetical protein